jgi:hypothetical protein
MGREIRIFLLGLGLVACADRKPLHQTQVTVLPDSGVRTVDGAGDRIANQDAMPASTAFEMIDDMEEHTDGRPTAPLPSTFFWGSPSPTRIGNWFVSWSDGSTKDAGIAVIDPARGDSQKAREIQSGQPGRSADLWAQLDHPAGRPVDVSAYRGVAFWARLTGGSGKLVVAIDGGSGASASAKARGGDPPFPAQTLAVSDGWQQFVLRFEDFGLQPTAVASLDFVVAGDTEAFDLWIDDLALLR